MSFKDILIHLDEGPRSSTRLKIAVDLARRQKAHLTGIFVVDIPGAALFFGAGMPYVAGGGLEQMASTLRSEALARAETIGQEFLDTLRREDLQGEWRLVEGDTTMLLPLHARYHDLTVLAQPGEGTFKGPTADAVLVSVLLSSGRPILAVPYAGQFERIGDRVLIAWNASREATRALNDALPLLRDAKAVTVLAVNPKHGIEDHGPYPADGIVPAAGIALHLARHGVKAEAAHTVAKDIGEGDALLSYAADLGADLIVCGGYGHSRAREMVFGGVTRTLLQEMTVPMLMSH
jgi:nucleotide-binding universal stress UspA family protein